MGKVFQENLFQDKLAFFTGGTSGIGLGIAASFAELGARVVLLGRDAEKAALAAGSITSRGHRAHACHADVRDYAALESSLRTTHEQFGAIDFLFCIAAGNFPAPVLGMSANGFKAVVDIDLLGTFNACRAAYPYLRKPGASLVNISANHARIPYRLQSHVCAAKAGVESFSKVLALEWGNEGIRVNCISPGPIDDTEGMKRLAPTEESRRQVIEAVPLGRMGTKGDIASLATFLCSEAATYITGAVYLCDGGHSLTGSRDLSNALSAARQAPTPDYSAGGR